MNVMYAEDKSLIFTVTPPMPLLDVVFHSKPSTVYAGETAKIILEINNKGNCALKNLKLIMNQNSLVYVGSPEMINDELYGKYKYYLFIIVILIFDWIKSFLHLFLFNIYIFKKKNKMK